MLVCCTGGAAAKTFISAPRAAFQAVALRNAPAGAALGEGGFSNSPRVRANWKRRMRDSNPGCRRKYKPLRNHKIPARTPHQSKIRDFCQLPLKGKPLGGCAPGRLSRMGFREGQDPPLRGQITFSILHFALSIFHFQLSTFNFQLSTFHCPEGEAPPGRAIDLPLHSCGYFHRYTRHS